MLEDAEQAAGKGDSKLQCVRALTTGQPKARICLRGTNGELLTATDGVEMLAKYAEELFAGDALHLPELASLDPDLLSVDRWYRALNAVRSGKALPLGEPAIRAWKGDLWLRAERLSKISISSLCGDGPFVPCDWTRVQIAWLPKPGKAPCAPKSLRSIGLVSADSKAFFFGSKGAGKRYDSSVSL